MTPGGRWAVPSEDGAGVVNSDRNHVNYDSKCCKKHYLSNNYLISRLQEHKIILKTNFYSTTTLLTDLKNTFYEFNNINKS